MSINAVESFWVLVNLAAIAVTIGALLDASRDQRALRLMNGQARTLVSRGNVRREVFRLIGQSLLLTVVLPSLFRPGEITFTFDPFTSHETLLATLQTIAISALISVPVVLLTASLADARERGKLAAITDAEILAERLRGAP